MRPDIDKIKRIVNENYAVERWMIDDLLNYLTPIIRHNIENEITGQFWEVAAEEGYEEGYRHGYDMAYEEVRETIDLMKKEDWDIATLNEVMRKV